MEQSLNSVKSSPFYVMEGHSPFELSDSVSVKNIDSFVHVFVSGVEKAERSSADFSFSLMTNVTEVDVRNHAMNLEDIDSNS